MDLGISEQVAPLLERVRAFTEQHIFPVEEEFVAEIEVDDPFILTPRQLEILDSLKSRAREEGLWNFFLTGEKGSGLNTVEYAYLAEEMGKSRLAAEIFNCSAPDTGNMEVLHKYGSEAQKNPANPSHPLWSHATVEDAISLSNRTRNPLSEAHAISIYFRCSRILRNQRRRSLKATTPSNRQGSETLRFSQIVDKIRSRVGH